MVKDEWRLDTPLKEVTTGGTVCVSAAEFAVVAGRSVTSIYMAVKRGNQLGRLRALRIARQLFIPLDELARYQWIDSGRYGRMRAYCFDYNPETLVVKRRYTGTAVRRSAEAKVEA